MKKKKQTQRKGNLTLSLTISRSKRIQVLKMNTDIVRQKRSWVDKRFVLRILQVCRYLAIEKEV